MFPLPELTDQQYAVLTYLARRRRTVAIVELAAELDIAAESVRTILGRLSHGGLVQRHTTRTGRWGRTHHSATRSGRAHARALAKAAARIAPLTAYGLTRRQAQVLYSLLIADAPLTIHQITARYVMGGIDSVRDALRELDRRGLCYAVEALTVVDTPTHAYVATESARALTNDLP